MGTGCSSVEKFCGSTSVEAAPSGDAAQPKGTPPKSRKGKGSKDKATDSQDRDVSRADSSISTQVPGEMSTRSSEPPAAAKSIIKNAEKKDKTESVEKKTDKVRVESNWSKLRKVALEVAGEINHFSVFAKKKFKSLDDGFNTIAGKKVDQVDLHTFVIRLEELEYTGDAEKVFYGMCDDQSWDMTAIMSRTAFSKRLSSIGNSFRMVVRQALSRDRSKIKKKVAQAMKAKNRDQSLIDDFRKFIEPQFKTPGKCFDAIAGDDGNIDEDEFLQWLESINFPGDAAIVFHNFCDVDGYITRTAFSEILTTSVEEDTKQSNTCADGINMDAEENAASKDGDNEQNLETSPEGKKAGRRRSRRSASLDGIDASKSASTGEEAAPKRKSSKRRNTITSISPIEDDTKKEQVTSKGRKKSKEKKVVDDFNSPEAKTGVVANGEVEAAIASKENPVSEESPPSRRSSKRRNSLASSGSVDEASAEKVVAKVKKKASKSSVGDETEEIAENNSPEQLEGGKPSSAKKKAQRQRRNSV